MNFNWSKGDPCSFAEPEKAIIRSIHLRLSVDFERHVLFGWAELHIECLAPHEPYLRLDTRDLDVACVCDLQENEEVLTFRTIEASELGCGRHMGTCLQITWPSDRSQHTRLYHLGIQYSTQPQCSGLAWLQPSQTTDGTAPFLFSQCQPIHARSIVPLQDTPSVKFKYTAEITVPAPLVCVMSALRMRETTPSISHQHTDTVFRFTQQVPIPSYLLALAVGRLEVHALSERCSVWAEPSVLAAAAHEFAHTETILRAAEAVCAPVPYVWQEYNLLVLPASFPYGGMENPCLTFVTPTLLAGDRSQCCVIAHEIAHSWTGNLVTNRNWEHFWLNEGLTVYLERKIMARLYGEHTRHMSALSQWQELVDCVRRMCDEAPKQKHLSAAERSSQAALTRLVPPLGSQIDPDDAFSRVPYEKGHTLLYYLEGLIGSRTGGSGLFDQFICEYIGKHQYRCVDSCDFVDAFRAKFGAELSATVDWEAWLLGEGLPPFNPEFPLSGAEKCVELACRWFTWKIDTTCPMQSQDLEAFSPAHLVYFLQILCGQRPPLSIEKLVVMQRMYDFYTPSDIGSATKSRSGDNVPVDDMRGCRLQNFEVRFNWLSLCIVCRWTECIEPCLRFVTVQHRMKYVRPIYRMLYAWPEARARAIETYRSGRQRMMHVVAHTLANDLQLRLDEFST